MLKSKKSYKKPSVGVSKKHMPHGVGHATSWIHTGLYPVLALALVAIALLTISRLLLSFWQWEQIPDGTFYIVMLQGLRVDFASVCGLFALPCLILCTLSLLPPLKIPQWLLTVLKVYSALCLSFLAMNELATPGFILEYGVRPNHIYVQYLMYPKEVFLTLWGGHKLELFLSLFFTGATLVGGYLLADWCFKNYVKATWQKASVLLLLTICIVPLGIRSTLGHRPLNPAMVSFSNNALANSLPVNSSYYAVYALLHLNDVAINESVIYKIAPDSQVLVSALNMSARTDAKVFDEKCPLNQVVTPFTGVYNGYRMNDTFHRNNFEANDDVDIPLYNVVVILEESLGDNFVESQGGLPITPYLEQMRKLGWWFENMYAAGHRSIRGIEAVTASMPPSPLNSIVKLPPPINQYATLFNIFKHAGYKTSFIYGGESHFDNMRTYFLQNGMDFVVEQKDYKDPAFLASWGVSDEDLFNKADEVYNQHYAQGEKFFSVVFSSSFHDPFDIPAGKVDLGDLKTDQPARLLAAKYADYALGKYIEKAQQSEYFKDTIFLIIADHESQVRGTGKFPLDDFTIPAVIIAPNVKPHVDKRQVSQIDMGMTLMSLAGLEGEVPNVGQNLLRADTKQRAIMQFNNIFGLLEGDRFIQISPHNQPYMFKVIDGDQLQEQSNIDKGMLQRAINLSNVGPMIYRDEYMSIECVKLTTKVPKAQVSKVYETPETTETLEAPDAVGTSVIDTEPAAQLVELASETSASEVPEAPANDVSETQVSETPEVPEAALVSAENAELAAAQADVAGTVDTTAAAGAENPNVPAMDEIDGSDQGQDVTNIQLDSVENETVVDETEAPVTPQPQQGP